MSDKNISTQCYLLAGLNKVTQSEDTSARESIAHGSLILEPHEDMTFESVDAAKAFYDEYSKQVGFVMDVKLSCPSEVEERSISCHSEYNKEGNFTSKCNELVPVANQHPGSGARCQAMMLIKSDKSGNWVVSRFLRDHNHPLVLFPRDVSYTMVSFYLNLNWSLLFCLSFYMCVLILFCPFFF